MENKWTLKFLKHKKNVLSKKKLGKQKRNILTAILLIVGLIGMNAICPIGNLAYLTISSIYYFCRKILPIIRAKELKVIEKRISEIQNEFDNIENTNEDANEKNNENVIDKNSKEEISTVDETELKKENKNSNKVKNLNIFNNIKAFKDKFEVKRDILGKPIVNGEYKFKKNQIIQDGVTLREMRQFRIHQELEKQKKLKRCA